MATQTQQLYPAPFLEPAGERITDALIGEISKPVDISTIAPQVAAISPLTQAAQQRTATQAGLGTLTFDPTTGAATGVGTGTGIAAYQPYLQQAESYAQPGAYEQFMSPYQTEVLDATQALLNEQRAAGRGAIGQQAVQAGAFGGGRQGVAEAEYERQRDLYDAGILANLRQQGLQQAQTQQQQALQNQLSLMGQQAQQETALTSQLGGTGAGISAYNQAVLDAMTQGNVLGLNYPLQRLSTATNILSPLIAGSPALASPTEPFTQSPGLTGLQSLAGLYGVLYPPKSNKGQ